jgi:hypothetical protein
MFLHAFTILLNVHSMQSANLRLNRQGMNPKGFPQRIQDFGGIELLSNAIGLAVPIDFFERYFFIDHCKSISHKGLNDSFCYGVTYKHLP